MNEPPPRSASPQPYYLIIGSAPTNKGTCTIIPLQEPVQVGDEEAQRLCEKYRLSRPDDSSIEALPLASLRAQVVLGLYHVAQELALAEDAGRWQRLPEDLPLGQFLRVCKVRVLRGDFAGQVMYRACGRPQTSPEDALTVTIPPGYKQMEPPLTEGLNLTIAAVIAHLCDKLVEEANRLQS